MHSLSETALAWLSLRRALVKEGIESAGLFQAYAPLGWEYQSRRVLYIGKATSGPFVQNGVNETKEHCFDDALRQARTVFESNRGASGASFWGFANQLSSRLMDPPFEPLNNLIWSNIAKIGAVLGNPVNDLFTRQAELAEETLRIEISTYKPSLVIFVVKQFGEAILESTVTKFASGDWSKTENEGYPPEAHDIWWKQNAEKNLSFSGCNTLSARHLLIETQPYRSVRG